MSAIEKTYASGNDYILYRNWWIQNYDKMIKQFGEPIWLYPFGWFDIEDIEEITPEFLKNNTEDIEKTKRNTEIVIWSTSDKHDLWLVDNCEIQSFRDTLLMVYSDNWKGFKGKKWAKKNKKPRYTR